MSGISAQHVWKYFGDFPALRDIHFTVERGACMALLGRNGAGKTTLLRIAAGLSRPWKGEVRILGEDARSELARRRIGVLGHGIGVYDELSAFENLRFFARLYELPQPHSVARDWLVRVGLEKLDGALVREFSRGMRQRLAIARAFLHDPQILLLDEPFTSLDDRAIALFQQLLREALDSGKTVMMSTHQLREALELATEVCLINRGRVVFQGERTEQMLADPGWLYRNYGEA